MLAIGGRINSFFLGYTLSITPLFTSTVSPTKIFELLNFKSPFALQSTILFPVSTLYKSEFILMIIPLIFVQLQSFNKQF